MRGGDRRRKSARPVRAARRDRERRNHRGDRPVPPADRSGQDGRRVRGRCRRRNDRRAHPQNRSCQHGHRDKPACLHRHAHGDTPASPRANAHLEETVFHHGRRGEKAFRHRSLRPGKAASPPRDAHADTASRHPNDHRDTKKSPSRNAQSDTASSHPNARPGRAAGYRPNASRGKAASPHRSLSEMFPTGRHDRPPHHCHESGQRSSRRCRRGARHRGRRFCRCCTAPVRSYRRLPGCRSRLLLSMPRIGPRPTCVLHEQLPARK